MEILPQTRLSELLDAHPELEETIVAMAEPFRNLRNPVLRRTVARVATLARVAQVGGLDPTEFVNALRRALGHPELAAAESPGPRWDSGPPEWAVGDPQFVVDAGELLARGEVPLAEVSRLARELDDGRHLLLLSEFEPAPLSEALAKAGFLTQTVRGPNGGPAFQTFVAKGERC